MSKFIKKFFRIIVPFISVLLVLLELFFRFVVPACERPQDFFDERNLIFRFDSTSNKEGTFTMGEFAQQRGKWRINNFGWNSPIDYSSKKEKKRIAVFGDSSVEALQVDCDKSYPSLLRKLFNDTVDVYSFAKTGAACSEYLNLSRYANVYFNPDILIFNVGNKDFYESILKFKPSNTHILTLNINDSSISENMPRPNYTHSQYMWIKRAIKISALVRYLSYNLSLNEINSVFQNTDDKKKDLPKNKDDAEFKKNEMLIIRAVDYILRKIGEENPEKRIIFVVNAPRNETLINESFEKPNVLPLNRIIEEYCVKYGFEFLDMASLIAEDYEKNHIQFYSELDGHYNEYGHRFASNQLFKYLTQKR